MAESSACLVRSFSQPYSSTSQDTEEGDPLRRALTASVSFGRFMSESLTWEKWSSFTQNRYKEEIEKYSKPGSVAEKKAYFEAHYKKKAAQKAAASLEEQNIAVNNIPVSSLVTNNESPIEMAQGQEGYGVATEDEVAENGPTSDFNSSVDEYGQGPLNQYKMESEKIEGMEQGKQPTFVENPAESSVLPEYGRSPLKGCRIESNQFEGTERGIEQPTFVENQGESFTLPEYGQSPILDCGIEDEQIYVTEQEDGHPSFIQKADEFSTLLEDAQYIIDQEEVKAPALETAAMDVSASSGKKKPVSSSAKASGPKQKSALWQPLKPTTLVQQPRNDGDQGTAYNRKTVRESVEKKRSTPKSIHMSICLGSLAGNTNKSSSPESQKLNSRLFTNLSKTTRESSKQQTQTMASTCGVSKRLPVTPQRAIRSAKELNHQISRSRTADMKSESLYMRSSTSSTTHRMKAEHHIGSGSFSLRTEERARKREEKLQQKLSMEVTENERPQGRIRKDSKYVRQSITSQDKANTSSHPGVKHLDHQTEKGNIRRGDKDVRQSITSQRKANANASSTRGMKHLELQAEKITRTHLCSPGVPRKQKYVQPDSTRPTWRHSIKDPLGKSHRPPTYPTKLLIPQKNSTNENTSPNTQL